MSVEPCAAKTLAIAEHCFLRRGCWSAVSEQSDAVSIGVPMRRMEMTSAPATAFSRGEISPGSAPSAVALSAVPYASIRAAVAPLASASSTPC